MCFYLFIIANVFIYSILAFKIVGINVLCMIENVSLIITHLVCLSLFSFILFDGAGMDVLGQQINWSIIEYFAVFSQEWYF